MQTTPITAATPFFTLDYSDDSERPTLLEVRAGVPIDDALNNVSCLLESAKSVVFQAAEDNNSSPLFGAKYLLDLAEAIVDAVRSGIPQNGGEQ